jgi:tetratricopeptide (TPR) repeat protein
MHMPVLLELTVVFAVAVTTTGCILLTGSMRRRRQADVIQIVLDPYQKGDFERALDATEGLREAGKREQYLYYRGAILRQLDRLDEAERSLTECIALSESGELATYGRSIRSGIADMQERIRLAANAQQMLGAVYLAQLRYDDAIRAFEASLPDCSDRASAHRNIAELWLRRGDADEALKWANVAVDEGRAAQILSRNVYEMNLGEELATLAWAVAAALKDRAQVELLVAEAEKLVENQAVTAFAQVHLHAGLACAEYGDTEQSVRHLEAAACKDLRGSSGRVAAAKVTELSASNKLASVVNPK